MNAGEYRGSALPSARGDSFDLAHAAVDRLLAAFIEVLQRRPHLAVQLKEMLAPSVVASQTPAYVSVRDYAHRRSVSERTIRYDIKRMTEGEHYHRAGQTGRRIVVHVDAADAWYVALRARDPDDVSSEQLAVDEVTRRRARVALKKNKEK